MLSAKLLDQAVVTSSCAYGSLSADLRRNKLKYGFGIIIKTSYYLRIDHIFDTQACKVTLETLEMLSTIVTQIVKYKRSIFSYFLAYRALAVKKAHGVLDKSFLAGITEFFLVRLEVSFESLVILSTACRTAYRIDMKLYILQSEPVKKGLGKRNHLCVR